MSAPGPSGRQEISVSGLKNFWEGLTGLRGGSPPPAVELGTFKLKVLPIDGCTSSSSSSFANLHDAAPSSPAPQHAAPQQSGAGTWAELRGMVEVLSSGGPGAEEAKEALLCRLKCMCELLPRKVDECAHLTAVIKDMSETRAEAIRTKVLALESYHKLQGDIHSIQRSSQLAHQVSRANCSRANRMRNELSDTRSELLKAKQQMGVLAVRNSELRAENSELRAVSALYESALETVSRSAAVDCRVTAARTYTAPGVTLY